MSLGSDLGRLFSEVFTVKILQHILIYCRANWPHIYNFQCVRSFIVILRLQHDYYSWNQCNYKFWNSLRIERLAPRKGTTPYTNTCLYLVESEPQTTPYRFDHRCSGSFIVEHDIIFNFDYIKKNYSYHERKRFTDESK